MNEQDDSLTGWREVAMADESRKQLLKVLALRVFLGLLGAFLLTWFFRPSSSPGMILVTAVILVFFAYVFEYIHQSRKD